MPYLVSSIIAVASAMIIMLTRYEADDSSITAELETMKSMFVAVDGFVNTYIESGGDLTGINFEELDKAGVLLSNMTVSPVSDDDDTIGQNATTTFFQGNTVVWQLIPNKKDSSSYKVLVDMRGNSGLMSKAVFSESFSGREYCQKMLFGTFQAIGTTYDDTEDKEDFKENGTDNDGLFVCIVYK